MSNIGALGAISFLVLGVVQLVAGYAGISDALGTFWAIIAVVVALAFRFTLPLTIGSFFGAMNVWGWNWFASILLALPGLAFLIPGMIINITSALPIKNNIKRKQNTPNKRNTHIKSDKLKYTIYFKKLISSVTSFLMSTALTLLVILIVYVSFSVFSKIDTIIINDDEFLRQVESKIDKNGAKSLSKFEREKYLSIKQIDETYDKNETYNHKILSTLSGLEKMTQNVIESQRKRNASMKYNFLGKNNDTASSKKQTRDYIAGRTGIDWEIKKVAGRIKTALSIFFLDAKYHPDPKFKLDNHWDELVKDIPQQEWGAFYSAKSLAHANELRRLLLYRNNFTN